MKTSDILINSASDAFFALSELDRSEADRILDEAIKLYDAAPDKDETDIFSADFNNPGKSVILADFAAAVTSAYKKRWVASLENAQDLIDVLKATPSGNACIHIANGVSLTWSDIDCLLKED